MSSTEDEYLLVKVAIIHHLHKLYKVKKNVDSKKKCSQTVTVSK